MQSESFWANPNVLLSLDKKLHTAAGKNIGPGGWWKDMFSGDIKLALPYIYIRLYTSYQMHILFKHRNITNKQAGVTAMGTNGSPAPKPKRCWTNKQSFTRFESHTALNTYAHTSTAHFHSLVRIWDLVHRSFSAALRERQGVMVKFTIDPKATVNYEFQYWKLVKPASIGFCA